MAFIHCCCSVKIKRLRNNEIRNLISPIIICNHFLSLKNKINDVRISWNWKCTFKRFWSYSVRCKDFEFCLTVFAFLMAISAKAYTKCKFSIEKFRKVPNSKRAKNRNDMLLKIKNFMDLLEESKKHRVPKTVVFRLLFCLKMFGKSTSYSTDYGHPMKA